MLRSKHMVGQESRRLAEPPRKMDWASVARLTWGRAFLATYVEIPGHTAPKPLVLLAGIETGQTQDLRTPGVGVGCVCERQPS